MAVIAQLWCFLSGGHRWMYCVDHRTVCMDCVDHRTVCMDCVDHRTVCMDCGKQR